MRACTLCDRLWFSVTVEKLDYTPSDPGSTYFYVLRPDANESSGSFQLRMLIVFPQGSSTNWAIGKAFTLSLVNGVNLRSLYLYNESCRMIANFLRYENSAEVSKLSFNLFGGMFPFGQEMDG
jgi:hypothetical protein